MGGLGMSATDNVRAWCDRHRKWVGLVQEPPTMGGLEVTATDDGWAWWKWKGERVGGRRSPGVAGQEKLGRKKNAEGYERE